MQYMFIGIAMYVRTCSMIAREILGVRNYAVYSVHKTFKQLISSMLKLACIYVVTFPRHEQFPIIELLIAGE